MKTIKTWLTTMAVLLCSITVSAEKVEIDGIWYNLDAEAKVAEVTNSGGTVYSASFINIPATVTYAGMKYNVTSIGEAAFFDCSGLSSITIPESVTSIETHAFKLCGFTSIAIPESVTSIGDGAFSYCSSLSSIIISQNSKLTSIGQDAFDSTPWYGNQPDGVIYVGRVLYEYKGFMSANTSIEIREGTVSISPSAFYGCSGLISITIPVSITSIQGGAFRGCNNLTSITIPEGVTSIESSAFSGCSSLTSVTIPNSVTSIGVWAFKDCSSLTSITIPEGVTLIENFAFNGCKIKKFFWKCITLPSGWSYVNGAINYTANSDYTSRSKFKVYPMLGNMFEVDGVTYVPTSMSGRTCDIVDFDCNKIATAINIGATVTYKNITFTVNNINDYTFYGNQYLEDVTLANQGGIGSYVFADNPKLTSVKLAEGVTSVGKAPFNGCNGLTTISVAEGNTIYDSRSDCNAVIETASNKLVAGCNHTVIPENVEAIGDYAFSGCGEIASVNIHENIQSIGDYAFSGCRSLAEVIIEDRAEELTLGSNGNKAMFSDCPLDSVYIGGKISYNTSSSYGYSPFSNNASLRTVVITDKEDTIYPYEFYNCSALKNITIGDAVTSIGDYAFSGCTSLESFAFGCSMETIGTKAFLGCSKMIQMASEAVNPPVCGANALDDLDKWNCVLSIPTGRLAAYQAADQWKEFLLMEDTITIKRYALTYMVDDTVVYYVDSLAYKEEVVLPEEPIKEGHTFTGWEGLPETMPIFDVTVTASFVKNKYVLSYVVDGDEHRADSVLYGDTITLIAPLEKEGHTFSGWSEVPVTMPADSVVTTGSFLVNSYLLTYKIDGDTIQSDTIPYGSEITMIEAPARLGYSFDGWDTVLTIMPADDVVINGSYTRLPIENFVINDTDSMFSLEENLQCDTITYVRTFKNTNWNALYVPFEIPVNEEFLADFEVADLNDVRQYDRDDDGVKDETVIEAFKVKSGVLEANYPYLIRAREAGEKTIAVTDATLYATEENSIDCSSVREKYTFTGTYSQLSSEELPHGEGYYALSGGVWQPVAEGASLGAFRFYLKVDSRNSLNAAQGNAIRMRIIGEDGEEDDATGIDTSDFKNQKSELIFDLQGRRVENPTKGIYIVNGVKRVF